MIRRFDQWLDRHPRVFLTLVVAAILGWLSFVDHGGDPMSWLLGKVGFFLVGLVLWALVVALFGMVSRWLGR